MSKSDKDKPIEIEFAPGCFDAFEGTQEELDALVADIKNMFAGKTREELEAESRELSDDDWDEMPDEVKEQIARSFLEAYPDIAVELGADTKRKLQ